MTQERKAEEGVGATKTRYSVYGQNTHWKKLIE